MPLSIIKDMVEASIISEYQTTHNTSHRPTICDNTLHSYALQLIADSVFNIHVDKMPYKTESKSSAEWSFRSSIAYALCVSATHFLPKVSPSKFHVKKSEVPEDCPEIWDLVEEARMSMIGQNNKSKKVKCIPVLPHLVTSTDEVTLFATSQKVNNAEKIHVTTRPTKCKNPTVSSSSGNNYTTKSHSDSHCHGVCILNQ